MFDVSRKTDSLRTARARAVLIVSPETIAAIENREIPKGDPLPVARVAAIQAAKNTSQIIPFCHSLPVDHVTTEFELLSGKIIVTTEVKAVYKTGVEMEALTAAAVAALTLYDMLKMIDNKLAIFSIDLIEKRGGKSDFKEAFKVPLRSAVLIVSDSVSSGKVEDISGKQIKERLLSEGVEVVSLEVVPDEVSEIRSRLIQYADEMKLDLVISTGGTGLGPRDVTPEAVKPLMEKEIPGIVEAIRAHGNERTPFSFLSRSQAGVRGNTIIVNLPGSISGVEDSMDALFPALLHAYKMIKGGGHYERVTRNKKLPLV